MKAVLRLLFSIEIIIRLIITLMIAIVGVIGSIITLIYSFILWFPFWVVTGKNIWDYRSKRFDNLVLVDILFPTFIRIN